MAAKAEGQGWAGASPLRAAPSQEEAASESPAHAEHLSRLITRREWPAVLQRVEQVGLVFALALGILPFHFVPTNVAVVSQMAQG